MTSIGNSGWIAHNGKNSKASAEFYSNVIGWNIVDVPMGDGQYSTIMVDGTPIGGFSPQPSDDPHWLVYITVADVDATVKNVVKNGGKIVSEPMNAPNVGRIAVIQDPDGAKIALITYADMMVDSKPSSDESKSNA